MNPNEHKYKTLPRLGWLVLAVLVVLTFAPAALAYTDTSDSDQESSKYQDARELYKKAQQALNREEYTKAAGYFKDVYDRYEDSPYAADALYWRAFALYRLGGESRLEEAQEALEIQQEHYQQAATQKDAEELYLRILGQLAAQGDSEAGQKVVEESTRALDDDPEAEPKADMDEKIAALHALMNMRSDRAIPILRKILDDRDPGKTKLREQALFLLCQHGDEDAVPFLIDIAKNDPDFEIRKQAVFWLSQSQYPSEKSIAFLQQLVADTNDPQMMEQAMFAISQHQGKESRNVLRKIIQNEDLPPNTRGMAVFWLGQNGEAEDIDFLKSIYGRFDDKEIKERVLFSVSQNSNEKNALWLIDVAFDESEPIESRKMALFWASQKSRIDLNRLVKMYDSVANREMREQVIFVLSQRGEKSALETMIKLARVEKDPKLREQLVFWIGQSKDPMAEDFLLEIINE